MLESFLFESDGFGSIILLIFRLGGGVSVICIGLLFNSKLLVWLILFICNKRKFNECVIYIYFNINLYF